jgi:aryl-alcohol dehydrogenase-like predicted oxidoreductase
MEDIQKAGNECRYGKIQGLKKIVSRMIFGTTIGPMIEGKNTDELLDAALAKGINTFDTARGYGRAEESLGGWMKRRDNREQVVVISKCGNCDSDGSVCVNRKVIETELVESLQALQTDYIDIYLLHRDDSKTPVGELIDTLNKLQKTGKIKVFGVSNWTHERIEEANRYAKEHQLQGFSVSSPHFGLAEQVADPWGGNCVTITGKQNKAARNWYRENQMPIIAYSSLARGLMAGRIKSSQEAQAAEILDPFCVKGYVCHDNFKRLARCEELAEKKGCTVSQIALVWMFQQGLNMYVLVSTTKACRLEENLRTFTVELSEKEIQYLNLQEE